MVLNKSLDDSINLIAALLHDVETSHGVVFNYRARINTFRKVEKRARAEGMGFLTKTLPTLGKALDKALLGQTINYAALGFETQNGSELPRFLGEFFNCVFYPNGSVLPYPCAESVRVIRQITYLFYKYELPYTDEQEQQVVSKFVKTETQLINMASDFQSLGAACLQNNVNRRQRNFPHTDRINVVREARILLSRLFASFDPTDIDPRHGPGAVATRQKLGAKYQWTNVSSRLTNVYPLDAYFYASLGHVCDCTHAITSMSEVDHPARVILVPKDSRGPRLISCEPVDFQWIQQGLGRAIVELVEAHPLTRYNVHFTDQGPNRRGALLGSLRGKYSTLDLNEASDRVSLDLVQLLFPSNLLVYLEAARTTSTVLPDGSILPLRKFAPMGSCLCFPILALTIWAILTAASHDANARESILVYGDDVIVPTAKAADAIELLESFGLKINRDKSCTSGLFRESCGMDAFTGSDVTPVRLRTVWSSEPSPSIYTSWISYANSFYDRFYYKTYELIVGRLHSVYGAIPDESMHLACPSLRVVDDENRPKITRSNKRLQKREFKVWDIKSPSITYEMDGWSKLLRYFSEKANSSNRLNTLFGPQTPDSDFSESAFSASLYTSRRTSMLVRRWR